MKVFFNNLNILSQLSTIDFIILNLILKTYREVQQLC